MLAAYQKAPRVTRDRMYLDAMEEIYGGINKILIDSRAGGNLMFLPLDKVMQSAGAAVARSQSQAPTPASGTSQQPASSATTADSRARDAARSRERETR